MKIQPLEGIVYLRTDGVNAGALKTDMKPSAVEYAEVLAVGEGVKNIKKGDKVFVKAWAVDNIVHEEVTYRFVAVQTNGILAIVSK